MRDSLRDGAKCAGCWIGCEYALTRLGVDVGQIMSDLHHADYFKANGYAMGEKPPDKPAETLELRGQRSSWTPAERIPGVSRGPALYRAKQAKLEIWFTWCFLCDRFHVERGEAVTRKVGANLASAGLVKSTKLRPGSLRARVALALRAQAAAKRVGVEDADDLPF